MAGEAWAENPRITVPEAYHAFVRLWAACRGGMGGIAHWPDAGGVNDQAAWVVDTFAALRGIDAALDEVRRRLAGG
ncbi:MAG: hypothetical protein ING10_14825 [Roseomonas sp.]|nr:hypothetical protein [Roseomonas sp.]